MITIARPLTNFIKQFLENLFKRFKSSKPDVIYNENHIIPSDNIDQKIRTNRPRKHDKVKTETFAELLETLEHTFNTVKLPAMKESWLERDSIVGLRKIGVHVPNPWRMAHLDNAKIDIAKSIPTIMCLSSSTTDTVDEKDRIYPKIFFAIKLNKLPWQVSQKTGTPFQFGAAYKSKGKLLWIHMYLTVVNLTGEIQFCDEYQIKTHKISRSKVFFTRSWKTASFLEDVNLSKDEYQSYIKSLFVSMHEWWSKRDERWNVVVKKNGDRVTFGVDNNHTPYYFKDRDKSIKTATGQTKKIVHYVKEHKRKVGDKTILIKEHIRGLQEFNWSGYDCQVISPKFQAQTSATFTMAGDDEEHLSNVIYLSKLGKILADLEEVTEKKRNNA